MHELRLTGMLILLNRLLIQLINLHLLRLDRIPIHPERQISLPGLALDARLLLVRVDRDGLADTTEAAVDPPALLRLAGLDVLFRVARDDDVVVAGGLGAGGFGFDAGLEFCTEKSARPLPEPSLGVGSPGSSVSVSEPSGVSPSAAIAL